MNNSNIQNIEIFHLRNQITRTISAREMLPDAIIAAPWRALSSGTNLLCWTVWGHVVQALGAGSGGSHVTI